MFENEFNEERISFSVFNCEENVKLSFLKFNFQSNFSFWFILFKSKFFTFEIPSTIAFLTPVFIGFFSLSKKEAFLVVLEISNVVSI